MAYETVFTQITDSVIFQYDKKVEIKYEWNPGNPRPYIL